MSQWLIEKDTILDAVEVMDLVPSRPGIPASEYFEVIGKGGLVTFRIASEVVGKFKVPGEGDWPCKHTFYLDRRVFLPFVYAAKDYSKLPFVFTANDKQLVVQQGKRRAVFDSQSPVKGYGESPDDSKADRLRLSKELRSLMYCARECATADPVSPHLNCVYVVPNGKSMLVYATNQQVQYRASSKSRIVGHAIPFPLYLVQLLGTDKLKEVHWRKTCVSLIFKYGRIWQPVPVEARKDFPATAIQQYVEKGRGNPVLFSVSSKRITDEITRVCSYLSAVRRRDWVLDLKGTAGKKEIELVSTVPQSVFQERLRLKTELVADFELHWPLNMLEPVFTFIAQQPEARFTVRVDKKGRSHVHAGAISLVIPRRVD